MGGHKERMKALLYLGIVLLFAGCAHYSPTPLSMKHEIGSSIRETRYYTQLCEYDKAVNTIASAIDRYPGNERIITVYIETVDKVRETAEAALLQQDYGKAGNLFALLLEEMKGRMEGRQKLPLDIFYIRKQIAFCSVKLTEKGLVRYRAGELQGAVSLWKKVLAFDPENREVRKAIETTTVQMKNLENIP